MAEGTPMGSSRSSGREGFVYCCDAPAAVKVETPTGTVVQCGSCGVEVEPPTDPIELAFWECGHIEVDTGESHVCPLDVCSATYKLYSNATSNDDDNVSKREVLAAIDGLFQRNYLRSEDGIKCGDYGEALKAARAVIEGLA